MITEPTPTADTPDHAAPQLEAAAEAAPPPPPAPADPIKVYNLHPQTGEFVSASLADESPIESGVFLVPAHATTEPPPAVQAHQVAVFAAGVWSVKPDWRGVTLYRTADGTPASITEIGQTPADVGATDQPMPSPAHAWTGSAWQIDPARLAALVETAKTRALAAIDQHHTEVIQGLVGNPTQVEKDTWALKLETASALTAGTDPSPAGVAFLGAAGITGADARAAWAAAVLRKSAAYAQVVGVAERLRDAARSAVKAAKDEASLKAALDAQRAAADAAVASLIKGA